MLIVIDSPAFDDVAGLRKSCEYVVVQALIAKLAVEALDERVLRRFTGRDIMQLYTPFLVLSPRAYNPRTSLSVGVRIASQRKGYPFEVPLKAGSSIAGVALADQVKSLNWRARLAEFAEEVSPATLRSVRRLLATFLELT